MGLGISEPKQIVVNGTVKLVESDNIYGDDVVAQNTSNLKHSKDGKIVLSPQPSDDPNDPLNLSIWQRDGCYIILLLCCILSTIHGPMLAPVTVILAEQYQRTIGEIAWLSSYMTLVLGAAAYPFSILIRKFGFRPFFLFGMATMLAADAWAACAQSYNSLLGARILSGLGQSVFETMGAGVIPELFFVHERGRRVAFFSFFCSSGVTLGTPIVAQVAVRGGMKWCFGALAIVEAAAFLAVVFFFFEPSFKRARVDVLANEDESSVLAQAKGTEKQIENVRQTETHSGLQARKTYWQRLKPWSGTISEFSLVSITWRTAVLNLHPTIVWAAIASLPLSWPVGMSFTLAATLAAPQYGFSATGVGNMYIAAWIGASASILFGFFYDKFCLALAKRNNYVFEPEFRLWYTLPGIVCCIIGFVGWGYSTQELLPWPVLAVFFAFAFTGSCVSFLVFIRCAETHAD